MSIAYRSMHYVKWQIVIILNSFWTTFVRHVTYVTQRCNKYLDLEYKYKCQVQVRIPDFYCKYR